MRAEREIQFLPHLNVLIASRRPLHSVYPVDAPSRLLFTAELFVPFPLIARRRARAVESDFRVQRASGTKPRRKAVLATPPAGAASIRERIVLIRPKPPSRTGVTNLAATTVAREIGTKAAAAPGWFRRCGFGNSAGFDGGNEEVVVCKRFGGCGDFKV